MPSYKHVLSCKHMPSYKHMLSNTCPQFNHMLSCKHMPLCKHIISTFSLASTCSLASYNHCYVAIYTKLFLCIFPSVLYVAVPPPPTPQDEIFMLTSPTSPPLQSQHQHSGNTRSNPSTPTVSHTSGISRRFERLSLKGGQSFFKFFGRGNGNGSSGVGNGNVGNGGGARCKRVSIDVDEFGAEGSSGSDHEDPFSVSYMKLA